MQQDPVRRGAAWLAWASTAVLLLCGAFFVPYLGSGTEMVRLRNAMVLIGSGPASDFDWTPATAPAQFRQERRAPTPYFVDVASKLRLAERDGDWQRMLVISEHLLSHPTLDRGAIQSDLVTTHRRILEQGHGYCGDHTRAFMALALASGMQVRAWAFSFDGFGGHGHILPEVWNREFGGWQLLDVYNNVYFHAGDGVALSAAALRQRMADAPASLRVSKLSPMARLGYPIESKLWDYYRRGLTQWYLVWGNDVFSYDEAVRSIGLGRVPRALEQFAAVLLGDYPGVWLLGAAGNAEQVSDLYRLKQRISFALVAAGAALLSLMVALVLWMVRTPHGARRTGQGLADDVARP